MQIEEAVSKILHKNVAVYSSYIVASGNVNNTYKVQTDEDTYCLKVKDSENLKSMYDAETKGLLKLKEIIPDYIANPIGNCTIENYSYLLLDWVENAPQRENYYEILGKTIARIHTNHANIFGFNYNNFIGSIELKNQYKNNWPEFFTYCRVEPTLLQAMDSGLLGRHFHVYLPKIEQLIKDEFPVEKPSLLHGDLWKGNILTNYYGLPVLVDPAIYYGHREMDIAMTSFTGNLKEEFYTAYNQEFPLEKNWRSRIEICQLFYCLIHINIYGRAYVQQTEKLFKKYFG